MINLDDADFQALDRLDSDVSAGRCGRTELFADPVGEVPHVSLCIPPPHFKVWLNSERGSVVVHPNEQEAASRIQKPGDRFENGRLEDDLLGDIGIRIAVEGRGLELLALSLLAAEKRFAGLLCREHLGRDYADRDRHDRIPQNHENGR